MRAGWPERRQLVEDHAARLDDNVVDAGNVRWRSDCGSGHGEIQAARPPGGEIRRLTLRKVPDCEPEMFQAWALGLQRCGQCPHPPSAGEVGDPREAARAAQGLGETYHQLPTGIDGPGPAGYGRAVRTAHLVRRPHLERFSIVGV